MRRYVIRAVNSLLHNDDCYSLEQINEAIGLVTNAELGKIEVASSSEKEVTISNILTKWILKKMEHEEAA